MTAFQVEHTKPAFGYRVDYAGHSVVLSGDTRPSANLIQFSAGTDVLIHEVVWAPPETLSKSEVVQAVMNLHTSPRDAASVFRKVKPRLAVYSHIVLLTGDPAVRPPTPSELLRETRNAYDGALEIGEDLMSIEVGDNITTHKFLSSN